ncbi:hypothetical protein FACS189487_04420 [Campylobacterota bacterium]|nr:hypothetical protein FACS189487_04420 [Campylobacterota bacterium]
MQAYEFSSTVENGFIRIPVQYADKFSSPVKVIVLTSETQSAAHKKTFTAIKLKTKGFKFDREAANER